MSQFPIRSASPTASFLWPTTLKSSLIALALLFAAPAVADNGHGGRTLVSGDSVFSDCGDADLAIELSGDLQGCLEIFPMDYACDELDGFARYREWGREVFHDDDGVSGFRTRYALEAVFTQGFCDTFDFTTQLAGGCDHKVFSGQGRYRGANGSLTFNDIIPEAGVSGASKFLYHGYVKVRD